MSPQTSWPRASSIRRDALCLHLCKQAWLRPKRSAHDRLFSRLPLPLRLAATGTDVPNCPSLEGAALTFALSSALEAKILTIPRVPTSGFGEETESGVPRGSRRTRPKPLGASEINFLAKVRTLGTDATATSRESLAPDFGPAICGSHVPSKPPKRACTAVLEAKSHRRREHLSLSTRLCAITHARQRVSICWTPAVASHATCCASVLPRMSTNVWLAIRLACAAKHLATCVHQVVPTAKSRTLHCVLLCPAHGGSQCSVCTACKEN